MSDIYLFFFILGVICFVVGSLLCTMANELILSGKEFNHMFVTGISLLSAGLLLLLVCISNKIKTVTETQERIEDLKEKYNFYLDGEKVSHPETMILDDYEITINDNKKEVILRRY